MNQKQFEALIYLNRNGNFVRAAEMLYFESDGEDYITPETLQYRIKKLEEEVGVTLYNRAPGKSQITLTREGQLFLREAIQLYDRFSKLQSMFKTSGQKRFIFAATELIILHRLIDPLVKFTKANPHVHCEMRAEGPLVIEHMVKDGQIDFGLGTHPPDAPDLEYVLWRKSKLAVIAPQGHPLTRHQTVSLQELCKYPLILLTQDLSRKDDRAAIDQAFHQEKLLNKRQIIMETSNSEIIAGCVEAGIGVGIVSETALHQPTRKVVPLPLDKPIGNSEVGILIRKDKIITPEMKSFFLLIDNKFKEWIDSRSTERMKGR